MANKLIAVTINSEEVFVKEVTYTDISEEEVGSIEYDALESRGQLFPEANVTAVINKCKAYSQEFSDGNPHGADPSM